ncbi:hypothetical protein OIU76_003348, partial [Salix suchowensis]
MLILKPPKGSIGAGDGFEVTELGLDVFLTMLIVTQSETASYEFTAFAVGRKCMLWNYIYVLADFASASPAPWIVKLSPVAGNVASSSSASISATESAVAGAAAMSFDHPAILQNDSAAESIPAKPAVAADAKSECYSPCPSTAGQPIVFSRPDLTNSSVST